jgi:hypothetical protein
MASRQREYQKEMVKSGRCMWCGAKAVVVGACRKHQLAHNKSQNSRYHRRKAAMECVLCGVKVTNEWNVHCDDCLERKREWNKKLNAKRSAIAKKKGSKV